MPLTSTWPLGRLTSIQLTDPVMTIFNAYDAVFGGESDGVALGVGDGVGVGLTPGTAPALGDADDGRITGIDEFEPDPLNAACAPTPPALSNATATMLGAIKRDGPGGLRCRPGPWLRGLRCRPDMASVSQTGSANAADVASPQ